MSVLMIDYWNDTDRIYLYVDDNLKTNKRYRDFTRIDNSICNNDSKSERYSIYDTNDFTHTAVTLNVSAKADSCECKSGGCKECGWMLPEIIIMIATCD